MRNHILLLVVFIISVNAWAQSPAIFNYQAVARDNSGSPITNQAMSIRITIRETNVQGAIHYQETANVTTNQFGLFTHQVGKGNVNTGRIDTIKWGNGKDYLMVVEMDQTGGTNYQLMGSSHLVSVPYALYADRAGNDFDRDSINELQQLVLKSDTLHLTKSNYVVLPKPVSGGIKNYYPILYVKDFGAKGDSITDDTMALQKALDSLKNQNGGELIFEVNKIYLISAGLNLHNASAFRINGYNARIKMKDGVIAVGGNHIIEFWNCKDFTVENIVLDGNRKNRIPKETPGHNARIISCYRASFIRCKAINSVTDGYYIGIKGVNMLDTAYYPRDILVQDCHAYNGYRMGLTITAGFNLRVTGGSYSHTNGTAPEAGIDIEPNEGGLIPAVRQLLFSNIRFENNRGYGLQMSPKGEPTHYVVSGNYFYRNTRGAMLCGLKNGLIEGNLIEQSNENPDFATIQFRANTGAANVSIVNNVFRHIQTGTLPIININSGIAGNIKVSGNVFDTCSSNPIYVAMGGTIVTDNVINETGGIGIIVAANAKNCIVTGNKIQRANGSAIQLLAGATLNVVKDNQCIDTKVIGTQATISTLTGFNIISNNVLYLSTANPAAVDVSTQITDIAKDNLSVGY